MALVPRLSVLPQQVPGHEAGPVALLLAFSVHSAQGATSMCLASQRSPEPGADDYLSVQTTHRLHHDGGRVGVSLSACRPARYY